MPEAITFIGNLGNDPELKFTPTGKAVANFSIGDTPRYKDASGEWKDGETVWLRASIWGDAAENVAESLTKGTRVIARGKLKQRSYEKDGVQRTVIELAVDEIAPSLKFARAKVTRTPAKGGGNFGGSAPAADAWGGADDDSPPF